MILLTLKVISLWHLLRIKRKVFNNRTDPILDGKWAVLLGEAYTYPIFKIHVFVHSAIIRVLRVRPYGAYEDHDLFAQRAHSPPGEIKYG